MVVRGRMRSLESPGAGHRLRSLRDAFVRRRLDARYLPAGGRERARAPGQVRSAEPLPGGGVFRFARAVLRVRVAVGGAVFCGWDGAAAEPSHALVDGCPAADTRASLEPDTDGGWRVVSERALVVVSTRGTVEFRTPGGALLRRDLPPRWWDAPEAVGGGRWTQRSELAADADVFGLGCRAAGPRLPEGEYRLWNTAPGVVGPGDDPLSLTMPVQVVAAGAGCHLVFHDNTWDGWVRLRDGAEGAGSGHDRPAGCELRMDGGPLRYWVLLGPPARLLQGWTTLTGRPALPPRWALGHQHARWGPPAAGGVREVVAGHLGRGLPLSAVHLDTDHPGGRRGRSFPDLPGLVEELRAAGVRLVSVTRPAVRAEPGDAEYDSGTAADVFCRDPRGRVLRTTTRAGTSVFPDFTSAAARQWWGELLELHGCAGVWHVGDEPAVSAAFGERTLPRSTRHCGDGAGGDHRSAHNVYGLLMARAAHEALERSCPDRRPWVVARSGWAGMQRYAGCGVGEVTAQWAGLRVALALVLGLGLCGVPYSGADVGAGASGRPSPELYLRWLQLGSFLPLFRTRGSAVGWPEPWEFGPEVLERARAVFAERERLLPYLYTLAHEARRTGAPYVRPVWWHEPGLAPLRGVGDAFLLGDALLVAPVMEPGVEHRRVRLPSGRWYDRATGRAYTGPGVVELPAPLERVPVLVRAGAVVPVATADGMELEVWAPESGDLGGGSLVVDAGDGWSGSVVEEYLVRRVDGRVVVERAGSAVVGRRVRVRGDDG
ncbi:glycosyl hydrolase [Wenjunlia vitaminophila]|uniref:Glycosyl hydrolase n=2 Tax=Wenjunlia vitaminophila TaxID=76728 RepID=A0A0T6LRN0_WENVI|nr:glycoside hydrolase family 31 protein [Wenjunlia vitaminophila]KRV48710.1 glycosyl hydrolase [Wenjunlia vitaminophila]